MPSRAAEHKSPYAKRPYTVSRQNNKKSDNPYLELEMVSLIVRF